MIFNWLAVVGLLILYTWPRYFFVSIAGKGVSGFTFFAVLLTLASLYLLAARRDTRRDFAASVGRSKMVLSIFVLYWLWRLMCDAAGISPAESFGATMLDFLYLGTWLFIGMVCFSDDRLRRALPYTILASGLLATFFGLLEYRTQTPLSTTLGFAEFQAGDKYTLSYLNSTLRRAAVVRIRSLFSHPLVYGQIMASMSPVALHFLIQGDWRRKILGSLLAIGIVVSITLSNARSPYFVAIAAGAVYFALFYLDPRRGMRLFVLLWAMIGLAIMLPIATGTLLQMASGRTSEEAISSAARDRQMDQGRSALNQRPIFGYGDGNATDIAGIIGEKGVHTVDNYYLTTAVDTGYVGVAIFILMLFAFVIKGIRSAVLQADTQSRSILCVAVATIVGLGLGLAILSIVDTLSIIFLMTGYLIAASGIYRPSSSRPLRRPGRPGPEGAIAAGQRARPPTSVPRGEKALR